MSKVGEDQLKTIKWNLQVSIFSFVIVLDPNRKNCSNVLILFYNIFKFFEQHYINSFHIRIDIFHSTSIWKLLV